MSEPQLVDVFSDDLGRVYAVVEYDNGERVTMLWPHARQDLRARAIAVEIERERG